MSCVLLWWLKRFGLVDVNAAGQYIGVAAATQPHQAAQVLRCHVRRAFWIGDQIHGQLDDSSTMPKLALPQLHSQTAQNECFAFLKSFGKIMSVKSVRALHR